MASTRLLRAPWLMILLLVPIRADSHEPRLLGLVPNSYEDAAVAEGRRLGIGSAQLIGPDQVPVYSYQTWRFVYHAGKAGIAPGGGIRVAMRHLPCWTMPQTTDPSGDGYLTARSTPVRKLAIRCQPTRELSSQYFAWQRLVEIRLSDKGLDPGESLELTYGDRSRGSAGIRVQPFDESCFVFKTYVDAQGNGKYLPLGKSPAIEIVAGPAERLSVTVPSDGQAGQRTWCLVRAEDRFGNPAASYRGTVRWRAEPDAELPPAYTFSSTDRGVHRFESVLLRRPGTYRLSVDDGRRQATGNPMIVRDDRPDKLLLWGDLHGHTLFSDGRGTVEEFYDFAQRVAGLDFCAVTDHAFEVLDEMWEHSKKITNQYYQPGRFVTFQAYEWSGTTRLGGDHNCYFLGDDPPLLRSTLMYNRSNLQMYHGTDPKQETITDVFAELNRRLRDRNVFCIPHYGGRKGNPKWHDPKVQRMVEIFSEHRRTEDWALTYLQNGHRLGIMASTDGHFGNPGYGYLKPTYDWDHQEIGMAAVAVVAAERTRESIFRALYDRRVYATSGDRIVLNLDVNGQPMGSEITTRSAPEIVVSVAGTDRISEIQIKKNGQVVHVAKPQAFNATIRWRDRDFVAAPSSYYYVRVVQENNEEAISSPVWVN